MSMRFSDQLIKKQKFLINIYNYYIWSSLPTGSLYGFLGWKTSYVSKMSAGING